MGGESRVYGRFLGRRRDSDDEDLDPCMIAGSKVKVITYF